MKFFCPHCGQKLDCNDDEQGTVVCCPKCLNAITVPTPIKQATVAPGDASKGNYSPSPTNNEEVVLLRGGTYWMYYSHLLIFAFIASLLGCLTKDVAVLFYIIALILIINFVLKTLKHKFVLTNKRLTVTNGIIIKQEDQVRVPDIRGISVRREFFDTIFNTGTIVLGTAATANHEILLFHVYQPKKIVEKIEDLRGQIR